MDAWWPMWSTKLQSPELTPAGGDLHRFHSPDNEGEVEVHDSDIRHPHLSGTYLSKYIHNLTGQGVGYTLKWEILKNGIPLPTSADCVF